MRVPANVVVRVGQKWDTDHVGPIVEILEVSDHSPFAITNLGNLDRQGHITCDSEYVDRVFGLHDDLEDGEAEEVRDASDAFGAAREKIKSKIAKIKLPTWKFATEYDPAIYQATANMGLPPSPESESAVAIHLGGTTTYVTTASPEDAADLAALLRSLSDPDIPDEIQINLGGADVAEKTPSALDVQVGGAHYKGRGIQPVEYIHANGLNYLEGCVVKRITRWRDKPAAERFEDLHKIKHEIDLLIELERKAGAK